MRCLAVLLLLAAARPAASFRPSAHGPAARILRGARPPPSVLAGRPQRGSATVREAALAALPAQALAVNTPLAGLGVLLKQKSLTPSGLAHAYVLGVLLWSCVGWQAWSTCVLYLVLGSAVTKVKKAEKEALGIAEGRGGARGPENVWGSAATAAICALCLTAPAQALISTPLLRPSLLKLALVASLATKLSDTFASEIGKAYGKRCFLITTLKPVPRGTEGAVSLEGTLAGVVGGALISAFGWACGLAPGGAAFGVGAVAAFVATNFESFLGASLQGKYQWLTNEVVNFINTAVGALCAVLLGARLGL